MYILFEGDLTTAEFIEKRNRKENVQTIKHYHKNYPF